MKCLLAIAGRRRIPGNRPAGRNRNQRASDRGVIEIALKRIRAADASRIIIRNTPL